MVLFVLGWILYALVVGLVAKALHPGEDPVGCLPTLGIGIAGSFVGGFLNWLIGWGHSPFETSGFVMGIIGGVIFLTAWGWYKKKQNDNG